MLGRTRFPTELRARPRDALRWSGARALRDQRPRPVRAGWLIASLLAGLIAVQPAPLLAGPLPADFEAALAAARIPAQAAAVVVQEIGRPAPRVAWQPDVPVNPASLMKLLPTLAALEQVGPTYTWATPVWLLGTLRDGVLDGSLVIKGQGDPRLAIERIWLLLRRVQQMGVREIRGDIVLDRSAFAIPETPPGEFDGEPLRPYNANADALLLNFRSLLLTIAPDAASGRATVVMEPSLAGVSVTPNVPLTVGPCGDWRGTLKADFTDPQRIDLQGGFPTACGERVWPIAFADPPSFNARLIDAAWRDLGGRLTGRVRDGLAPSVRPTFELTSPSLAEVIRDINKFSNNVMAQQLFLTLALPPAPAAGPAATVAGAREVLTRWAQQRFGDAAQGLVVDNGSGLSRESRASARLFARLLTAAWASPVMPEFIASLPLAGADGTSRRMRGVDGRAHLKTGSLRDVAGIAGFVHAPSGRRFAVVAIVNHPQANAARPAFEALIQGLLNDGLPATRNSTADAAALPITRAAD